jgi:hypothetical protein
MATAAASGTGGLYGPADQYDHSKVTQFIGKYSQNRISTYFPTFPSGISKKRDSAFWGDLNLV